MPVTLINPFHLTSADESAFVRSWKETASVFAGKQGYLDTRLHRSIDPNAHFQFVNIAHWESAETWSEAMKAFPPKEGGTPGLEASPALYRWVEGGSPEVKNASVEDELREIEEGLARAYQTHDTNYLKRVLADDYSVTDGPGTVSDKAHVLSDHADGRLRVDAFHFDEMHIQRLSTDTAIVRGQYTWTAFYTGHLISGSYRYLRVYLRAEGGWQIKAGQVTPVLNIPR